MERARNKYTTEELAAWAMKPFWGLLKLLQGPIQAVILLLMHAFRLGLTLEFHLFADSRPDYFVQTLLDKQFDFEGYIDDGAIIPMLIRGSKLWPRIRLAVLRFAGIRSTGRSADVVLMSAHFLFPAIHAQSVGHLLKAKPGTAQMESG